LRADEGQRLVSNSWTIREANNEDAAACGRVIYEAFGAVNARHGFATRWPSIEFAGEFARGFIALHGIYAVVCELDGDVIGCNFLDERGAISGVGPTAVASSIQGTGVGRALMLEALHRASGHAGVRLLQDAFNASSLALYASLGFEVKEPVVLLRGSLSNAQAGDLVVRTVGVADFDACARLCRVVHGFDRSRELSDAVSVGDRTPLLGHRDERVVAYSTGFGTFAHAVAETERDMRGLVTAATRLARGELEFLLPSRQPNILRWCLGHGMRVVKQMNLMAIGDYSEPRGCWIPSVLY
jgi:predicted N-acetyltransferase YhbS